MKLPRFPVRVDQNDTNSLPPYSDKAILPPNILEQVINCFENEKLPHPLIFKIHENQSTSNLYISVKEFTSPLSNLVILPSHILHQISSDEITLELISDIPKAKSLNLQPKHNYNILNWKYFLEYTLTKFYTVITTGETLIIQNDQLRYELDIVEIDGSTEVKTVGIIDADILLDIPSNEVSPTDLIDISSPYKSQIEIESFKSPNFNPKLYKVDLTKFSTVVIEMELGQDDVLKCDLIASLDKFLTIENFYYSTMDDFEIQKLITHHNFTNKKVIISRNDEILNKISDVEDNDEYDKWLYIIAFSWDGSATGKLIIREEDSQNSMDLNEDISHKTKCSNCLKYISSDKFYLHESFCIRNNVKCVKCDSVFLRDIPVTHWHCPLCEVYTNLEVSKFKHNKLFHETSYQCICKQKFENHLKMSIHKSSVCPNKLHTCRFCHLVLPQGEATYLDKFENLTNHENQCGNRTTECYKCQKIIRLKDLKKHLAVHDLDKQQFNQDLEFSTRKCLNENCINELSSENRNNLDLCGMCYGPLYNQNHDPTHIKLQQRIERKYMLQLTKGCGNDWCNNKYCIANDVEVKQKTFKEKLELLKTAMMNISSPVLPANKGKPSTGNKFWFCVGESVLIKKMIFDIIKYDKEYSSEVVLKAVNEARNEKDARSWLQEHGVKVSVR